MKIQHLIPILFLAACGTVFGTPAPTINTTPTNGPTTVTVHARTTDGKLPVGVECFGTISRGKIVSLIPLEQITPPTFSSISKSEEWIFTDVPPDYCYVCLQSSNYVKDANTCAPLHTFAGTNYTVDFVLSRGSIFNGRVLDDATGKPISDQPIFAFPGTKYPLGGLGEFRTDAEGRYELPPVAGPLELDIVTTNYVAQVVKFDVPDEGSTVSVPDIRLKRGGWISGRVERSVKEETNFMFMPTIKCELQGPLPTNSAIREVIMRKDGTFRTDPLPPGTYTLHADWPGTIGKALFPVVNNNVTGSISNIIVIAGQDTTNVVIPTKLALN